MENSAEHFPWRGKTEGRGEGIAVEDEDGVGGKLRLDESEGAAGAEGFGFAGESDAEGVGGTAGEPGLNHLSHVAGGEKDVGDAVGAEPVELPFEKRLSADGDEAFRAVGKLRGDAGAPAPEQNDGLRDHSGSTRMPVKCPLRWMASQVGREEAAGSVQAGMKSVKIQLPIRTTVVRMTNSKQKSE